MREDFEKLFTHLTAPQAPSDLSDKIIVRIRREEKITEKRRFLFFLFGFTGSLCALIPTFQMMRASLADSGFMQFSSLLFSDFWTMTAYWKNFFLTLLEALPVLEVSVFLGLLFAFLGSLKFLARDAKIIFRPREITN